MKAAAAAAIYSFEGVVQSSPPQKSFRKCSCKDITTSQCARDITGTEKNTIVSHRIASKRTGKFWDHGNTVALRCSHSTSSNSSSSTSRRRYGNLLSGVYGYLLSPILASRFPRSKRTLPVPSFDKLIDVFDLGHRSERASKQVSRSKCRHCFLQRSSFFWVPLSCATRRQAPIPYCRLARWPLNTRFLFRCPRSPCPQFQPGSLLAFFFSNSVSTVPIAPVLASSTQLRSSQTARPFSK